MKFFLLLFFFCVPLLLSAQTTQSRDDAGQIGATSGFYETYNPINFPAGATNWWHLLDVRHSNPANNFAMQFAGSFYDQHLWFRKTDNPPNREWSRILTETNGNLNGKIYMLTPGGQNFFTGHQAGGTYSYPGGIFKAVTDNPYGQANVYYEGVTAGMTNFSVRADGQGYFATGLGIGTQNPGSKLTVAGGDVKAYNYDNNSGISIGAEHTERPRIGFHVSDNSRRFKMEVNGINSANERLGIFSSFGGLTGEQEVFSVHAGGNVGIGETAPKARLHLKGTGASVDGGNHFQFNGTGLVVEASTGGRSATMGAQVEFVIPANTEGDNPWGQGRIITVAGNASSGNATGKMIIGTRRMFNKYGAGEQWFYGDDLVIDGTGNIGIGTLKPKEKLSVFGTVRAMEVKVEPTNWPDYVFAKEYKILSLKETEQYIKKNKHLPEIPSATEVAGNGLALGEMNKLLLKKIEELTLHLIEKDKQYGKLLGDLKKQGIRLRQLEKKQVNQ